MKTTKKVRLVIEVEIEQEDTLTPEVLAGALRSSSQEDLSTPDWQENIQASRALLAALLANPTVYQEWVVSCVQGEISNTSHVDFLRMLGFPNLAYDPLEQLVPTLPAEAQQFWRECQETGTFGDANHFVPEATQARIVAIRLEDAV